MTERDEHWEVSKAQLKLLAACCIAASPALIAFLVVLYLRI